MKKTFTLACLSLALSLATMANIRPVHQLFPVKQPDGTTVMLYKGGDRHFNYYTTSENQVVVRNSDGVLCYAQLNDGQLAPTAIVVHNDGERTAEEQQFVATNTLTPTDVAFARLSAEKSRKAAPMKLNGASTSDGLGKYGTTAKGAVPSIGNVTIPVIMVQFTDTKFQEGMTQEKLTRYFNEEGYNEDNSQQRGSVKDYFVAQSFGKFNPTFDVVALVTLDHGYAYYGQNSSNYNDVNAYQMVRDAVAAAVNQGVSFSKYVNSSTNNVPNVTIYYAGPGEATGGDENTIWPHELDLSGTSSFMSNTRFGSYFVGNEIYGDAESTRLMGMGVFCHEFSHAMGLPDFYDPTYSYTGDSPFGLWSLMDGGSYANGAYAPVGYNAYERSFMGWLNIRQLSNPESIVLADPNQEEGESAVLVRNPNNQNEYFILENRQPGTWYNSSYGSGLLISRYAYSSTAWTYNTVNTNQSQKRACVVTANGSGITDGTATSAHLFGNGTNNKTSYTLLNGNTLTGNELYKIMKQPDGTIVFNYRTKTLAQSAVDSDDEYVHVTDLSQIEAKDTVIIVCLAEGVALSVDQQSESRGAVSVKTDGDKVYANDLVLKTTISTATVSGKTGYTFYDRSSRSYLQLTNDGTLEMKYRLKASAICLATISFTDGNANIVFEGSTATNNTLGYNADDVKFSGLTSTPVAVQIYKKANETSGIATIATDRATTSTLKGVYTLSGQYVGPSTDGLSKGIYICGGRKVVVK